jgi:hypothetical protein
MVLEAQVAIPRDRHEGVAQHEEADAIEGAHAAKFIGDPGTPCEPLRFH